MSRYWPFKYSCEFLAAFLTSKSLYCREFEAIVAPGGWSKLQRAGGKLRFGLQKRLIYPPDPQVNPQSLKAETRNDIATAYPAGPSQG
jgi:hypothetical protein